MPSNYQAKASDQAAWDRAHRPEKCKLVCHPNLNAGVSAWLRRKWSPEQIAGWLKQVFLEEPLNQVSHETTYRSIYKRARGVLKKKFFGLLQAKRTNQKSRHASLKRKGLDQIKELVSISERPASIEVWLFLGTGKYDLIGVSKNSIITTLVELHWSAIKKLAWMNIACGTA